jgi:large conductance mechanosensitive channel
MVPSSMTARTISVNCSLVDPGSPGAGGGAGVGIGCAPAEAAAITAAAMNARTDTETVNCLGSLMTREAITVIRLLQRQSDYRRMSDGLTTLQEGFARMLKGFKEFLARGSIVDLAVAVVIGTAFTALVTKFTDSIIQPLINRIGAGGDSDYGVLRIDIGGGQTIDLNVLLSAAINFILIAAVVYFLVVLPYTKWRDRGGAEEAADTELSMLTEIRDLLADRGVDTAETKSADKT